MGAHFPEGPVGTSQKGLTVLESLTRLVIRYAETDRMGLVHHSHYPVYFEAGRTDFFAEHLMHYHEFEQLGLFAPVLELEMKLEGRASYGDVLVLVTRPLWMKGVRLAMGYEITREGDRALVATGTTTHALVGRDLRAVHPRHFEDPYRRLKTVFAT